MPHDLENTVALLARTPVTLNALIRGLPDTWIFCNEGGNTWTVAQVIGHLIHGERVDWVPRVRTILESGEKQTFAPFDREGFERESKNQSLTQMLDEFAELRAQNLGELRALNIHPEQLALRGRHPSLGQVTLSELLATWAVHDLTHLHQISRIMAYQYRDIVGPWSKYLGVLTCNGHSAGS